MVGIQRDERFKGGVQIYKLEERTHLIFSSALNVRERDDLEYWKLFALQAKRSLFAWHHAMMPYLARVDYFNGCPRRLVACHDPKSVTRSRKPNSSRWKIWSRLMRSNEAPLVYCKIIPQSSSVIQFYLPCPPVGLSVVLSHERSFTKNDLHFSGPALQAIYFIYNIPPPLPPLKILHIFKNFPLTLRHCSNQV